MRTKSKLTALATAVCMTALVATANAADIETALVIHDLMVALGFERFEVRINNRLVLNGLLEELGIADRAGPTLIALDKLGKQGRDAVLAELTATASLSADAAAGVVALAETRGSNAEVLDSVDRVTNRTIERRMEPRRAGAPDALVADNRKILASLPWRPKRADLDTIVRDALAWERALAITSMSLECAASTPKLTR